MNFPLHLQFRLQGLCGLWGRHEVPRPQSLSAVMYRGPHRGIYDFDSSSSVVSESASLLRFEDMEALTTPTIEQSPVACSDIKLVPADVERDTDKITASREGPLGHIVFDSKGQEFDFNFVSVHDVRAKGLVWNAAASGDHRALHAALAGGCSTEEVTLVGGRM